MKKTLKRFLSLTLAFLLMLGCFAFIPNIDTEVSAAGGVKAKLDAFMQSYPNGSRWTGSFDGGIQCYGFAGMVIYNVFGKSTVSGKTYRWWNYAGVSTSGMKALGSITSYSASNVQSLLANAKCGDVLQFDYTSQHSMIVYSVESDGVWIYDCNWDGNCGIRLKKCSFGSWSGRNSNKLTLLRSDNYATIDGSQPTPSTHTIDSSYGKNFTTYPKAKITAANIFDANHNQIDSTSWIGTSDLCTIHEVYTDGCCKVTYPLNTGGTKTVYSYISLFSTPSSRNNTMHVFLSPFGNGYDHHTALNYATGSGYTQNRIYAWFVLYDKNTGDLFNTYQNGTYSVNIAIYDPNGNLVNDTTYNNSDNNWISIIPQMSGTYIAKATMSGDYTGAVDTTYVVNYDVDLTSSLNSVSLSLNGTNTQTVTITVSGSYPGSFNLRRTLSNSNISTTWGSWDGYSVPLTITGNTVGTTNITIQMYEKYTGNENIVASITIPITVTFNSSSLSINTFNNANISSGGEIKYYSYTPSSSGKYVIYSTSSEDTKVYLYNSTLSEITYDDDSGDSTNFRLEYNLTAGTKYIFGVKYYSSSKTGTIPFKFGKVYTISYNANGGLSAPAFQNKDYGKSITLSSSTPTRVGYTFQGWATSNSAISASYNAGDSFSSNANTTLYAVWKINTYTVTFKDWDGTTLKTQTVNHGSAASAPANPTRTGYTFTGWDKTFSKITANTTVTAKYSINSYTVTFKDWDGTTLKTQTVNYGSAASAPANPTRTGYTFTGWDKSFSNVTANTTVTAKYSVNTYTVTFNDWDGTIFSTQTVNYGSAATAPANPVRTGYTFTGWDKTFSNITANTTVTAKYSINAYTVTFKDWDGSILKTQTVSYGSAATAPSNPSRTGYTFTGWDVAYNNVIFNLTVTAMYIKNNESHPNYTPGDVNNDKCVDNLDAAIILKYDAGIIGTINESTADVNNDGVADNLDAAIILKYDAGLIPSL